MNQKARLLGLAFAGADLLFEVDASGAAIFALGAVEQLTGLSPSGFVGVHWADLVEPRDADLLGAVLEDLRPGERQGPLRVTLRSRNGGHAPRHASLSVFRMPTSAGEISCALSLGSGAGEGASRRPDGLLEPHAFASAVEALMEQAEQAGLPVRLDLIELDGLGAAVSTMDAATAEKTRRHVAAVLRAGSFGGLGAAEVATDRFAVVRSASASNERLASSLERASGAGIAPKTAQLALDAPSAAQNLRAMRYALDRYIEDGPTEAAASFAASVQRTVRDTARFKTMLADGAFQLAYQPVVALADASVHHFEALARFDADASPADTIRMAEELDLISDFDVAVMKSAVAALAAADDGVKVAANISALSLKRPRTIEALLTVAASSAARGGRLLIEITETHVLSDLPAANAVLQRFRAGGQAVCLDDFGAGAASLDYLRHLDVDFVKIDGRYVQALGVNARDALILKHVVGLCRDLGVATIAEMIETPEAARLARTLGVDFGQGWHFGKPASLPALAAVSIHAASSVSTARRRGVVETWG